MVKERKRSGRRVYPTTVLLLREFTDFPNDSLVLTHQMRTIAKKMGRREMLRT